MAAHLYWKIGDLTSPAAMGYLAGAEAYLRQSTGGANEIPIGSTASRSYASPPSVLYDGDPSTWWASNGSSDTDPYVAFQYPTAIDAIELLWLSRSDAGNQAPLSANIYYSDTGLTGPWALVGSVAFSTWSNGNTQTSEVEVAPPSLKVSEQSAQFAFTQPGAIVTEQSAQFAFTQPGAIVTEQSAYVAMMMPPPPVILRRRSSYVL